MVSQSQREKGFGGSKDKNRDVDCIVTNSVELKQPQPGESVSQRQGQEDTRKKEARCSVGLSRRDKTRERGGHTGNFTTR